ncbi:hypothetical protein HBI91_003240 [Parastagonospora nodorum]|nr:hypothetical protein HBI91_003240 [Parastagonospora nodorum]KAH5934776.1 hypothetical protein HBI87_172110 [Parastagonospora nodorum]KAH5956063.1 hypothetical protein HBI85_197460 [Parastagonospora nodorum]
MRLLRYDEQGNLSLTKFFGGDIPPYAILWKSKAGYRKLEFCGRQAAKDGLSFFWVDTCCIDKSSSMELGHAISSMFRWYKDAARCYVHLRDVCLVSDLNQTMSSLHSSRWFTRSWTLQELLAPESVEFFDSEGNRIGDRVSLMAQLHDITKIPQMALQGITFGGKNLLFIKSRSTTQSSTYDQTYSTRCGG